MALHPLSLSVAPRIGAGPGGASSAAPNPRLVKAAHEFEAQMMKELLKPMTEGSALDGEDSGSDSGIGSGSAGALGEFAAEALGQGLSEQGGFGIADGIIRELSHSSYTPKDEKVTSKVHRDTVMRGSK